MTNSLFSYDDEACQPRLIDPWDEDAQYAPTPGDFGCTPATLYSLSPTPDPISCQTQPDYLRFLPFAEWEKLCQPLDLSPECDILFKEGYPPLFLFPIIEQLFHKRLN